MSELRKHTRHPVNLWAVHHEGEARFYCYVRNLSVGGLFFETQIPFAVGTPLTLELEDISVRAEGVIVHARDGNGVAFRELTPDGEAALKSYLSAQ